MDLSNEIPFLTIECPQYPTRIQLTKTRRAKYYTKDSLTKTLQTKLANGQCGYDKQGRVIDTETKKPLVRNKASINKPRYLQLSGNAIISGFSTPHLRNLISSFLHSYYTKHIKTVLPLDASKYPIRIEWDIHTTLDPIVEWDLSNLFFYNKYFEDALKENGIIIDDNWKYITHSSSPRLIPIQEWDERKFVFRFYTDNRPELEIVNVLRNNK
jgi:hypothetical protein